MELNRDTIRKIQGLVLFTVVVVVAGVNYRRLLVLLGRLLHIGGPFIIGGVIAFILNVPMRRIEAHLPVSEKHRKIRRPISLCLSILLVAGILFLVFFVVAPELFRTLWSLCFLPASRGERSSCLPAIRRFWITFPASPLTGNRF